jgi:hypothetical protein
MLKSLCSSSWNHHDMSLNFDQKLLHPAPRFPMRQIFEGLYRPASNISHLQFPKTFERGGFSARISVADYQSQGLFPQKQN